MNEVSPPASQSLRNRILIVEDEQVIAINLRESLEGLGYIVPAIASTAEKAIEKAIEHRPNLVLMDIRLKGEMDGIEAAEQIWNRLQIPVIYVTGHSDQSTLERAKITAPFGYILKPIREKELYITIETALQRYEREQLLSTVFAGMGDGVIVADSQGRVKFLNRMAEELTEWRQEDARDQALSRVFDLSDQQTQEPSIERLLSLALEQNGPIYLETPYTLTTKGGRIVPVADSITAIQNSQGEVAGVVVVFRDVTQRLLAEERDRAVERAQQLEQQMEELRRLNRLKEDFLATVSHELRTPLSNIQLATRMLSIILDQFGILAHESDSNSHALGRYIRILKDQSEQELRLVNDLLDMQRINAEAYPLDLAIVQLQDWVLHIIEPFAERMNSNRQELQVNIEPNLPTFQTDTHVLTRIVSELLQNACKYTPAQQHVQINVSVLQPEKTAVLPRVLIEVCNSGIEIPEEELVRIFDPFYRIPQSDRWAKEGTGLGLALVKKFAAHLGGSVEAKSFDGQTCFMVYLPIQPLYDPEVVE
ncbi:MAG TPA: ATP-binding protein [Crinalium sp.]|jgi:hypothetical protein